MSRSLFAIVLVTSFAWGAAVAAAPWTVTPQDAGCVTQTRLNGQDRADGDLVLGAAGDEVWISVRAAPLENERDGRAFLPVVVDGRRYPLLFQRRDDRLVAVAPPPVQDAIARGARLSLPWRGRAATSLRGSRLALEELRSCAEQVRLTQAAEAQATARRAEAESALERAQAADARGLALEQAQRRYREDILLTLGANLVGAGAPAGSTSRTYSFPGAEPVTCTGGLDATVCR